MRRLTRGALALGLLLASCGGRPEATPPTPSAEPEAPAPAAAPRLATAPERGPYVPEIGRYGGTLRLSTFSAPKRFNPITAAETTSGLVTGYVFEGLTTRNLATGEVEPHLATSWDVNGDGTEYTFHLRKDVTWFDGKPFTSADVLFTLEAIFHPSVGSSTSFILTIDGEQVRATAPDAHTVVFHLPSPYAPFLRAASFAIVPKHKLEAPLRAGELESTWGVDTPPADVIGTGPFRFVQYQPGERFILQRNPTYWKKDAEGNRLPYLKRIVYNVVQSRDVEMLKFQQGETDTYGMRGKDYQILKPQEAERGFTIYATGPAFGSAFAFFNQNRGTNPETGQPYVAPHKLAWFTSRTFRQAVAHAVDKQNIIDIVMNGLGYPQWGPVSPSAGFFYNPNVREYPYDLAKARALLAEIGMRDRDGDGVLEDAQGHDVEFTFFTNSGNDVRIEIAEILRKDLEQLGMKVHFNQIEFNTLVDKLDATFDWDCILLGLTGGDEPHFSKNVWDSKGTVHMWYPEQPEPATPWEARIDALFNAGVQELDRAKRKAIYDEWQVIVSEEVPLIYTCLTEALYPVQNRFGNLYPTALGGAFHNVDEIYVLSGP